MLLRISGRSALSGGSLQGLLPVQEISTHLSHTGPLAIPQFWAGAHGMAHPTQYFSVFIFTTNSYFPLG